jgi:hypothetical protein
VIIQNIEKDSTTKGSALPCTELILIESSCVILLRRTLIQDLAVLGVGVKLNTKTDNNWPLCLMDLMPIK